jgi:flagella basal body P-ring formation protein FlgA
MSVRTVPPKDGGSHDSSGDHPAGPAPSPPPIPSAPVLALPRNRRRPVVVVCGLLVVVIGGLAAWWGVQQTSSRTAVVVMAADVSYGDVITLPDLDQADVLPDPGVVTVPWSAVSSLVGKTAATDLLQGTLLTPRAVTAGPVTTADQSIVGVTVTPSRHRRCR